MSDNLANLTRAIELFDSVCAQVPSEAWDNDSPCEGWTARDVLRHQCGVLDALASIARTGELSFPTMPDAPADPAARWAETRDGVTEALNLPGALDHEGKWWFGPMSVEALLGVVSWDPLTHSWDIAQAAGIDVELPADLCEISLNTIKSMGEGPRKMKLITDPVEISDDAPIADRYLAYVGRQP
ncbi:TIGR03086 family metal-binding protein [Candidatus Poriferisodalis sp.]|uniref:TIGR03086 family metal-binding protein n=1 Tax=Candidatus Poriferisodalis sp. TaxID=3101277 RepID=UPI003D0D43AB